MNLTMYGDEDTPIAILIERKRLDKYVPPKILRTLGDYVRRKAVIEELKSKEVMTIRPFSIVIIELKEKLKSLPRYDNWDYKEDTPRYGGKMYGYRWVYPFNSKVVGYYKGVKGFTYNTDEFIKRLDQPEFQDALKNYMEIYHWEEYPKIKDDPEAIKKIIKRWYGTSNFHTSTNKKFEVKSKTRPYLIKMRIVIGTMNYNGSGSKYYHATNLKKWDKVTKKTSNAGLKADTTYSWSDEYSRGGWTFGGITIDTLEYLYRVNNGLKPNATKDANGNKITLKYGDYAEWYLHKLQ